VQQPARVRALGSGGASAVSAAGCDCDYCVRADYSGAAAAYSEIRLDQFARFPAAEVSRGGADSVGDCERRDGYGKYDDAD